jgi:hypothetical protein
MYKREKIPSHTTIFILLKLNKLLGQHVSIIYDHLQAPIDILFLSAAELQCVSLETSYHKWCFVFCSYSY